ncbi:MAG: HAMP domain-containing histidine kinase [Pseudonocardia sp.]|nr:HAMP domain-containing histidine kinase [Pseudonocardia sp.]
MRLTILYGLAFLLAGAGVLTANDVLLHHSVRQTRVTVEAAPNPYGVAKKLASDPAADQASRDLANEILRAPPEVAKKLAASNSRFFVNGKPTTVTKVASAVSNRTLNQLLVQGALILALMAVAAALLGWYFAGRALRPMAEAFAAQQRFVANASHELRTPLTIMRTEVDVALRDPYADAAELRRMAESVSAAVDRSERLVDSLLVLASSDGAIDAVPLDLAEVADDAVDELRGEAGRRAVDVRITLDHAPVAGDGPLLTRMVQNLVENGIRHNHEGGWVEIATRGDDGIAALVVTSTGDVISAETVDDLFEPFRRGDHDRLRGHGAGLGLSIVRAVAAAHGGRVEARPVDGGGLRVEVRLPRAGA